MTIRCRTFATILGVTALALTGCASGPPDAAPAATADTDLIELAQQEGTVVWYTRSRPDTVEAVQAAFEAEYGIEVVSALSSGTDLGRQIDGDVRSTGGIAADVVMTADLALADYLGDEGLLSPLPDDVIAGVPAEFVVSDTAAVYQISVPVIAYNSDLLGDFRPSTWDDLLDPRLSGQLMVNDPRGSSAWAQLWATLLDDPDLGEPYLEAIAAQHYQPTATSLVGTEQLVAGQGSALIAGLPVLFTQLIADGQPIDYYFPTDPTPVFLNVASLASGSEHPNAARLFLRWLLGEEGQAIINGIDQTASPLGDAVSADGVIPLPDDLTTAPPPNEIEEALPRILELLGFN